MTTETSPFYVFDSHTEADEAIRNLSRSGFDVKKLSLVGKGFHSEEQPLGFYTSGDKIKSWGGIGAFWGGIWGLLLAPAVVMLPGIGLIAMAGPMVPALIAAIEGAVVVGGMSALGAALSQIGMGSQQAIKYESAVKVDKYVLMVHGSDADRLAVHVVLRSAGRGQVANDTAVAAESARTIEAIGVAARAHASESTSALFNGA
jgi:hypothetical protein